ncbi:MAG: hypothetical protein GY835_24955, partial [bacterium]|nr:hypothetical protein [bacterium]
MTEKKQDPSSVETKQKTAHDETFKTAFREFFADLIELVDSELAATLDLAHAKIQEEDPFADFPGGQVGRADLVAETPTREGEHEMVMVHVEVSGKFLDVMDRRMRRYGFHIELKHDKPVVPIAVFLTGGPEGVELREVVQPVGKYKFIVFRYLAFGLSRCLAEEWVHRPQR